MLVWEPVPGMWVPTPEWVPGAMWVPCRAEVIPAVVLEEVPEARPVGRAPVFSPAQTQAAFHQQHAVYDCVHTRAL